MIPIGQGEGGGTPKNRFRKTISELDHILPFDPLTKLFHAEIHKQQPSAPLRASPWNIV
jgi:hypothetical protein